VILACAAPVSTKKQADQAKSPRSAEVPDANVLKMIKRAEVTLELETSREIDYSQTKKDGILKIIRDL